MTAIEMLPIDAERKSMILRRGFLTALAGLGTAGLIHRNFLAGSAEDGPAPAVPTTRELLEGYSAWLFYERRLLTIELYPQDWERAEDIIPRPGGKIGSWHFRQQDWTNLPQPSTRAAAVLGAAGVPVEA
jgi:hypothetical protein